MRALLSVALAGMCLAAGATAATAEMRAISDKDLIAKLDGVAPPEVLAKATILNMAPDGSMKTVREGSNGWTCMDPTGTDPMCADAGGMEWGKAFMSKGPAPQSLGLIYMLKGDGGASNTDPFASGETPDNNWVVTGPHVMVVGAAAKDMLKGYPRDAKADPKKPYVMWPGTPYEHLMLPVK
jgi:hypothetical protein